MAAPERGCAMASIYNADDTTAYERSMDRWSRLLAAPFLDFAIGGGTVNGAQRRAAGQFGAATASPHGLRHGFG